MASLAPAQHLIPSLFPDQGRQAPRPFAKEAGRSWKRMVLSAEAALHDPAFALERRPDRYVLVGLIPGATGIKVTVEDSSLVIRGTSRQLFSNGHNFGYVRELPMEQTYTLPADAAEDKITHTYDLRKGLLVVTIPRTPCLDLPA